MDFIHENDWRDSMCGFGEITNLEYLATPVLICRVTYSFIDNFRLFCHFLFYHL